MTNSEGRELEIPLEFLPDGNYKIVSYSDTDETKENAEITAKNESEVGNEDSLKINMVSGGGYAAWLEPVK